MPSKNQEFPKRDPWREQVRPKRHKKGVHKRASSDLLAHFPPSEKRPTVATRNPSRKPSMLLSHKDYYCFLTVLAAPWPLKGSVRQVRFLRFGPKRGPFWDPLFFTCGPLGPPKGARGFNTGTCWLPGEAPEAPKVVFGGGPKSVPKRSPKRSLKGEL